VSGEIERENELRQNGGDIALRKWCVEKALEIITAEGVQLDDLVDSTSNLVLAIYNFVTDAPSPESERVAA